jgi:hypothetical protein
MANQVASELIALDARIDELASAGNLDALRPLLADDYVYTHSTGHSQDKAEWLDSLVPLGGQRQRVPSSIEAEQHGDIAVTRANLDIVWRDGRPTAYNRYVRVWRRSATGWQVISQATLKAADREPGKLRVRSRA